MMIQQDILYISTPDGRIQLGLNCTCQTIALYAPDGRMIAERPLSPNETRVIHTLFQQYPDFVFDTTLQQVLLCEKHRKNAQRKVFRVMSQLRRRKLAQLNLRILRVNQIGYLLEVIPAVDEMKSPHGGSHL